MNEFVDSMAWPEPSTLRLRVASPWISQSDKTAVAAALESGWVGSQSPHNQDFEHRLSERLGQSTLACSNGSVALMLSLRTLGVGPGDEVIVPALTYAATASSVVNVGATPVFADVEPATWCLDPLSVDRMLSSRTRAIVAVHLYGVMADLSNLRDLCNSLHIRLVEDAAEALGGTQADRSLGTFGDSGTFSFFANKLISTGEGGAVTFSTEEWTDKARLLRGQGMDPSRRYFFVTPGFNFRLSAMQAALGASQLERFEEIVSQRSSVEAEYDLLLNDLMQHPESRPGSQRAPWIYTARFKKSSSGIARWVAGELAKVGIETRPVFIPLPAMPAFRHFKSDEIPQAMAISQSSISLPTSVFVTNEVVEEVATAVRQATEEFHANY